MQIPFQLRKELADCVSNAMNDFSLQPFTVQNNFGVTYDQGTSVNRPAEERIPAYIEKLNQLGTILDFTEAFYKARQNNTEVQQLYGKVRLMYERNNNKWQRNRQQFHCVLLKKVLPFLGRDEVRDALYKMTNAKSELVVIEGKPRSGLSYIWWYLSEIAEYYECFDFYKIDLRRDISKFYPNQLVTAAHIANEISTKLGMDYPIDLNNKEIFKIQPFINKLQVFLNLKAKEQKPCLLFIDQFDIAFAADVKYLIDALATLITENNGKSYIILAGYKDKSDWSFEVNAITRAIDIGVGSFTKTDVDEFFEKVYDYLIQNYQADLKKAEFLSTVSELIPEDMLGENAEPNVTYVGRTLTNWYKNLYEKVVS